MEIKSTDSSSHLNQNRQDAGLNTTGELNLYLDLLAFSELSPEEQLAAAERLKGASSNQILEDATGFPGFVEATDSFEMVLSSNETSEPLLESLLVLEQPHQEQLHQEQLHQEQPAHASPAGDPLALLEPAETSEPVFEFLPASEHAATIEPARAALPSETTQLPVATVEAKDIEAKDIEAKDTEAKDIFRASGPLSLSGFLFDPTLKAAPQVMTFAVCAACGSSETDGEDMFCAACGSYMDEKAEASGPACDDCGLIIASDELICPSCGSVSVVC